MRNKVLGLGPEIGTPYPPDHGRLGEHTDCNEGFPNGTRIDIDTQMSHGDVFLYQMFAIPAHFFYPLTCPRLREDIGFFDFMVFKLLNIARKIKRSANKMIAR